MGIVFVALQPSDAILHSAQVLNVKFMVLNGSPLHLVGKRLRTPFFASIARESKKQTNDVVQR